MISGYRHAALFGWLYRIDHPPAHRKGSQVFTLPLRPALHRNLSVDRR